MMRSVRLFVSLVGAIAVGVSLSSCGALESGKSGAKDISTSTARTITDAKLYYNHPIQAFARVDYKTPANHPNYYDASLERSGCTSNSQYGLRAHAVRTYGTEDYQYCLNLETGVVGVITYRAASPFEKLNTTTTYAPPAAGGNYFTYVGALSAMLETLKIPGTEAAVAYMEAIIADVKALSNIDALNPSWLSSYAIYLDRPFTFVLGYKASTPRDIEITYQDDTQVFSVQRKSVAVGESKADFVIQLPKVIEDAKHLRVTAVLLPVGGALSQKLSTTTSSVGWLAQKYEQIFNTYVHDGELSPGKTVELYLNWRGEAPYKIIVRLVGPDGLTYGESSFTIENGVENRKLTLAVANGTPLGKGYKLVSHMVPSDGSWDQFVAKYEWTSLTVK